MSVYANFCHKGFSVFFSLQISSISIESFCICPFRFFFPYSTWKQIKSLFSSHFFGHTIGKAMIYMWNEHIENPYLYCKRLTNWVCGWNIENLLQKHAQKKTSFKCIWRKAVFRAFINISNVWFYSLHRWRSYLSCRPHQFENYSNKIYKVQRACFRNVVSTKDAIWCF